MMEKKMSFEEFLMTAISSGADVRLKPVAIRNAVRFYGHLDGVDGPTVDFQVSKDVLFALPFAATSDEPLRISSEAVPPAKHD